MPIASGIAKQLRYKKEVTFDTDPGASGAQLLRRVESNIGISKDTYQSNEIRPDYQIGDFRHGTRKTEGGIKGELSPKTYSDFMAASVRKAFAAVSASTSMSITIAGSGPWTVTRAAGSFITDGYKAGDVGRLTAGTFNAANLNKNLFIVSLTATVLTVVPLNGIALVAEGPISSATFTLTGKKTFVPTTGHTDDSFAFEHWYGDIAQSELMTGCKIASMDIQLPATGMATVDIQVMGVGSIVTDTSQHFTSPTAVTTTGVNAAVNGVLYVGGVAVAIATGLNIKIDGGYSGESVIGSNKMPAIFPGPVSVTGDFTAFFTDGTWRDSFLNETEMAISAAFTTSSSANADFIGLTLPRIKLGTATRTDGTKGVTISCSFTALFNSAGGSGATSEQTTISIQDSAAA